LSIVKTPYKLIIAMKYILLFISLAILLFSCETDFETTAEWKDITVVYGLLDQRDSVQYLKINKAFLGEGDVMVFAKENDSINYDPPLNVWLEEWDANGNKIQTIIEFDTATSYKPDDPDAVFSTGAQRIYKGVAKNFGIIGKPYEIRYIVVPPNDTVGYEKIWLNEESTYKLFIQYPDSSKTIIAETYLVNNFTITRPFPGSTSIKFVPNPANTTTFSWEKAPNDDDSKFRYELHVIFYYKELNDNNEIEDRSITLSSGVFYPQGGASELYSYYKDNNFFSTCINQIPYEDPAEEAKILERYTGYIDVKVSVAASEFNLFMQVYEPSTSIVQEKPTYTNVENGIGIFSSRYYNIARRTLHTETVADLQQINYNQLKIVY
jgi:hypothetical protein